MSPPQVYRTQIIPSINATQAQNNQQSDANKIQYYISKEVAVASLGNELVDLVIGISPYGYNLINTWVDARLKLKGYVLVLGNTRNPSVKTNSTAPEIKLIETGLEEMYREAPDNNIPSKIEAIRKIIIEEYPSNTTQLSHSTELDYANVYQKIRMNPN